MDGLTLGAIIAGVTSSAIFFLLGIVYSQGHNFFANRHFRKIWFQFLKQKDVNVVITTRPGPKSHSTPRVSLAEVRAFNNMGQISSRLGIKFKLVESSVDPSHVAKGNLIILGGPKDNSIANHFWNEIRQRVPFDVTIGSQCIVSANKTFEPEIGSNGLLSVDYSLVVKLRRDNTDSYVFLFSGCHGFGTAGSTFIVSNKDPIQKLSKRVGKKEFVGVVKSTIVGGVVDSIEIVDAFLLTN